MADWHAQGEEDIKTWTDAQKIFSRVKRNVSGHEFVIQTDLSLPLASVKQHLETYKKVYGVGGDKEPSAIYEFIDALVNIILEISSPAEKSDFSGNYAQRIAEYFLTELFISMNMANPGCFDLYNSNLYCSKNSSVFKLNLSNSLFENARIESSKRRAEKAANLELAKASSWLIKHANLVNDIAETKTDKVLFAILHMARSEISPATVIWIFYALESLLGTAPGQNLNTMTKRLTLLLSLNAGEAKKVSKALRSLYDVRSSFVHGGMRIYNPFHHEFVKNSHDSFGEIIATSDIGFSLLLASLQRLIIKNSAYPEFKETIINSS